MKEDYSIGTVSKAEGWEILKKYHYLATTGKSVSYKSGYNYGLFKDGTLLGVCIFTGFPVPELVYGMFGLPRNQQQGMFELSRLCLDPDTQNLEHNITSWFVARSIRQLKKDTCVRAILSYADSDYHSGIIYRACNFKYYGKTAPKKDFWFVQEDGTYKKLSRGKTKGLVGEWRPRSDKHRFLILNDNTLKCKWKAE
tara:strand:+ start:603 stop:1193 length:591 start_codon:yes stop_codon:yes gene_type:complete